MRDAERSFREFLREKNLKRTPERMAVLRGVLSLDGHFDADQLLERVQSYNKRISRATIYRVLPLLIDSGFVVETLSARGRVSYERSHGSFRHGHMICERCQEVIEFRSERLEELVGEICTAHGFVENEHRLSVRGICKQCTDKKGQE